MGCTSTHKVNKFEVLALVTSLRCQEVFGFVYVSPDVCCNKLNGFKCKINETPAAMDVQHNVTVEQVPCNAMATSRTGDRRR